MRRFVNSVFLAGLLLICAGAQAQEKGGSDTNRIPKKVMEGLEAKFPGPAVSKWTREKEGDMFVYDIEFTLGGRKYEADISEDGTIQNWEKAIALRDLPAAVRQAVGKRFPKANTKEIMEITTVKKGKDHLAGYEIVLSTRGKNVAEVTVAPNGKILEDPGDVK